jgi:hypothetical protein
MKRTAHALAWLTIIAGLAASPAPVLARPEAAAVRAADPAEARAAIQDLLRRMAIAIGAADQDGYLACIAMSDPCWAMEQKNWAKDLGRKAPESFEVALTEDELATTPDGLEGKLKWTWRMPGGKERSLTFKARFVRGEGGWQYAGEVWNVLEGDRCRVLYADGLEDVAKSVADVLPDIRAHVHEGFDLENDKDLTERVQQVKLYSSMKHLQHSIYLSYSDGLSGWNEPHEAVKILARSGTGKRTLQVLLGHEYGHVATFQYGAAVTETPWWILEGVAEMAAERYAKNGSSTDSTVRRWASSGKLMDWDKLADFHGEAVNHMSYVYTQGHSMIRYVSAKYGRDGRNRWLRELAKGTPLDAATRTALGLSFADLDTQWRQSVTAPKPETGETGDGAEEPKKPE